MHFEKRLLSAAAVVLLAAAVIFGSTFTMKETASNSDKEDSGKLFSREETIYFWYGDEALTNYVNAAAVSFGEKENVHVIPQYVSGSEYLENIYKASLEGKQYPDVYIVGHDSLEKAYLSGIASEIHDDGFVSGDNFEKAALAAVTYKDKKVAYPLSFDTSILLYNEDYLAQWAAQRALVDLQAEEIDEETGETISKTEVDQIDPAALNAKAEEYFMKALPGDLEELKDIANSFDVPEGVEGFMKWDVSDILYNYWIIGNYMNVGGETGDDWKSISVYSPEVISCLEEYTALNQFFFIEPDTVTYDSVVEDFLSGKIVFTIATADIVKTLDTAAADGTLAFNYGVTRMPMVSEELKSRSMSLTQTVAVNGFSEHRELANRFAAYLTGEYAEALYDWSGKLPANKNTNADKGMIEIFRMEYADSIPLPKMMETEHYWLMLESLFAKAWKGVDVTALVQELEILLTPEA